MTTWNCDYCGNEIEGAAWSGAMPQWHFCSKKCLERVEANQRREDGLVHRIKRDHRNAPMIVEVLERRGWTRRGGWNHEPQQTGTISIGLTRPDGRKFRCYNSGTEEWIRPDLEPA